MRQQPVRLENARSAMSLRPGPGLAGVGAARRAATDFYVFVDIALRTGRDIEVGLDGQATDGVGSPA